jgi:hypothetical protein
MLTYYSDILLSMPFVKYLFESKKLLPYKTGSEKEEIMLFGA